MASYNFFFVNVCGVVCVVVCLFFYVWVLSVVLWCSVVGVWGVASFVLSVMRVVGGVPLWVVCVFRRVDVVGLCLFCTQLLLFWVRCIVLSVVIEVCVWLRMRLFVWDLVCISCMCYWMFAFATFMSFWVDVMVILYT